MGIDVITGQAHVVVASIQTYLDSSEALALAGSASPIAWTKAVTLTNGHPWRWNGLSTNRNTGPPSREGAADKAGRLSRIRSLQHLPIPASCGREDCAMLR